MAKKAAKASRPVRDYVGIAVGYARDVVDGRVPGCRLLNLRCRSFLDELDREWEYKFDLDRATKPCKFIEALPVPDAQVDQLVVLQPWQCFIVCNLFGWIEKKSGHRRFTKAHIWVAAGNGKSFLASAIGLYMAFGDGQRAAEVDCVAHDRHQARIVLDTARQMMMFRKDFADFLGVEVGAQAIVQPDTASKIQGCSSDADTLNGLRPYCIIVDELHVVDVGVLSTVTNRLAKRDQTLLLTISTAGYDNSSIGKVVFDETVQAIRDPKNAPEVFALVYQADTEADLSDEREWAKAHPNLDITVRRKKLQSMSRSASQFSAFRSQFITEQLNRWASSRQAWMQMDKWDAAAKRHPLHDHDGEKCFIGLDLSRKNDICGKAYIFVGADDQGRKTYCIHSKPYLPSKTVQASQNASYAGWVHDGFLTETEGEIINFKVIENDIVQDIKDFPSSEVCYDPAFAASLIQNLLDQGIECVEIKQGFWLHPAMQEAESALLEGRLKQDGNPCASWQVGNVEAQRNSSGLIRPDKSSADRKIDVAVAMLSGMARASVADAASSDPYAHGEEAFMLLGAIE